MSTWVELPGPQQTWSPPAATHLDEATWQAWVAKGQGQDRRSSATRVKAVKRASVAGLLGAAGLWSHLPPLEVLVRFFVTASALILMFQVFQTRHYPVAPVFDFSGDWQRAVVVASAAPFVASLVWPNGRKKRTESNG